MKGKSRAVQVYQLIGPRDNDELLHHAVAQYQQALELYRNRQWDQAVAAFESAREGFGGDDPPSDTMIEPCRAYATTPPPADWDGSFVRDVK